MTQTSNRISYIRFSTLLINILMYIFCPMHESTYKIGIKINETTINKSSDELDIKNVDAETIS